MNRRSAPATRQAAAQATEAADAVLAWLRTQSKPGNPETKGGCPRAGGADSPPPPVPVADPGTADTDAVKSEPRRTVPPDPCVRHGTAPLRLAHTDWLYHRLRITGPETDLAAFRTAAAGAGTVPWQLDGDRMEEDVYHLLVAPPTPAGASDPPPRSLSLAGARILAGQLRAAVVQRQALAVARVGQSQACPFDLHALVPVPEAILWCGPDDPQALAWLWQHWGTTHPLRHVAVDSDPGDLVRRPLPPGETACTVTFWSADWTPWRALARIAADWPALRFETRPQYDTP
jgi:hypothetical protein